MAHKAPGKHHREGISLIKLSKMFPDNSAAEKWFAKARWPEGTHCPHCESVNVQSGAAHKSMPYRCRERECRKRFSVRTGTCMEASNLGFQIWAIAVYRTHPARTTDGSVFFWSRSSRSVCDDVMDLSLCGVAFLWESSPASKPQ